MSATEQREFSFDGTEAADSNESPDVVVDVSGRAEGLLAVIDEMNLSMNNATYQKALASSAEVRARAFGGPERAMSLARAAERDYALEAREKFIQVGGYMALIAAGLVSKIDVNDMIVIDWHNFNKKYFDLGKRHDRETFAKTLKAQSSKMR